MLGLKVYPDTLHQYKNWELDFFEIYIRPKNQFNETISLEDQILAHDSIKTSVGGIHGGILHHGVNLMDEDSNECNRFSIQLALDAANYFQNTQYILFHPGNIIFNRNCHFKYLISLVSSIQDKRFMIEYEPIFAYKNRFSFPLHQIEDWMELKKLINKELVLDTGHALITAEAMNYDPITYLSNFIETINPPVIHLAMKGEGLDGYEDAHLHLYEGNFDLFSLKKYLHGKTLIIEVNNPNRWDIELAKHLTKNEVSSKDEFITYCKDTKLSYV